MAGLIGLLGKALGGLATGVLGDTLGSGLMSGVKTLAGIVTGGLSAGATALGLIKGRAKEIKDVWGAGTAVLRDTGELMDNAKRGVLTESDVRRYVGNVENVAASGMDVYRRGRQDYDTVTSMARRLRGPQPIICNVSSGEMVSPNLVGATQTVYNPTYTGPMRMAPRVYDPKW